MTKSSKTGGRHHGPANAPGSGTKKVGPLVARLARQTRKLLGKHYTNKYGVRRR
jgi:hypothetical protein